MSISSIVNATEANLSLEWSNYVWKAYTKGGKIIKTYHQNYPSKEYLVYCYQEAKESPPIMFSTEYRKTTVNNKTLPLLYEHIPSINQAWWEGTPENTLPKVLMAISRGYPANKEKLIKKFGNDEGTLYRGTQFAVWAITGQYDKDNGWKNVEKEPQAAKVTKYILGIDSGDTTYKIGEMYEDIPNVLPDNTQVSYFEPKNSKYQTLLALENIEDPEKVHPKISVSKVWDNISEADMVNNLEIKVAVKRDNHLITYLNLNADNSWHASYIDEVNAGTNPAYSVAELDEKGNEVSNTVTFDGKNYNVNITSDKANNFIIKNTYIPQSNIPISDNISIDGSKTWDDDNNRVNKRPESITIRLYANGEEKEVKQVTKEDDWKWLFKNLPKYENGKEVIYTITEDAVENYTSDITGYDVINHYTPGKISVNITKAWDDKNNQDGNRPKSITINLLADGVKTGKSLVLSEENEWTSSFEGLDEYKQGQKINYTVKEEDIEGYVSQISGNMTKGYVITNKVVLKDQTMGETEPKNKDNNKENSNKNKVVTPNTIDESNVIIPSLLFVLSLFSLIYLKIRYIK